MTLIALFRCGACGAEGSRRELQFCGRTLDVFVACDACIASCDAILKRVRPIFDAMLAAGVDRSLANEAMTFLLDRWDAKG